MYLQSISSAFPAHVFTQAEAYAGLSKTRSFEALRSSSQGLLGRILLKPGAIDTRHFCTDDLPSLVDCDPGDLNDLFEIEGTKLATESLSKALAEAGMEAADLDAVVVCTCTGYLCPGLSSYVAGVLGMRDDVYLQDIVGLGCGAAIPAMRAVHGLCCANPAARVGLIAVELCSAAFYMDNDPGVLISLCLFGDGASASIWTGERGMGEWKCDDFQTLHQPQHRELLRFDNENGFLRNRLDRAVPQVVARAVSQLHAKTDVRNLIAHGGGKDVVDALEETLGCGTLVETRSVLRDYGNLSSPSVLVALERRLRSGGDEREVWMTSFGAGFAAHSCRLSR